MLIFKKKMKNFPRIIPVFPLSNFIIFPKTSVPLNIFEPRYIDMIDDAMKLNKFIGMVQPRSHAKEGKSPELYNVGCMGKIISFNETNDGRYLIELKGILRFQILEEISTQKKYRECRVDFNSFKSDLVEKNDELKFQDLELNSSVNKEFQKKVQHRNFLFSSGIDFIYEFFNIERKITSDLFAKSLKFFVSKKPINKIFKQFADNGLI